MTDDTSIDLDELDAQTRAECEARAAELGVSVENYVNDRVLLNLILTQGFEVGEETQAPAAPEEAQPSSPRETQVMRQRLESVDRRLILATGGFENAVESIEGSIASLAARADDSEERDAHNTSRIDAALADLRASVAALDLRFDGVHTQHETLSHQHAQFRDQTVEQIIAAEQRLEQLEDSARHADRSLLEIQSAMEDARATNGEEMRALAGHIEQKISSQHQHFRSALQEIAEHAEALTSEAQRHAETAAQRAIGEARAVNDGVDQRLIEAAADAHGRIDQVLAHTGKLYDALAEKIAESERCANEAIEDVRLETTDMGGATRAEIARVRRSAEDAHAVLRAELAQHAGNHHGALQAAETKLSGDITDIRERHLGSAARIKLLDAGMVKLGDDVQIIRAALDERICDASEEFRAGLAGAQAAIAHHSDALATRIEIAHQTIAHAHAGFKADSGALDTRVRTALETQAREHQGAIAALGHEVEALIQNHHSETSQAQARLETDFTDMRTQHKGALARLKLIDEALDAQNRAQQSAELRTVALSERFGRSETENSALGSILQAAVSRLSDRLDSVEAQAAVVSPTTIAIGKLEDLASRLQAHESEAGDAADRASNLARLVGKLSGQYMETATQIQERLHKLEISLADARLERLAAPDGAMRVVHEALASIDRRFGDLSQQFDTRIEALRGDTGEALDALAQVQHQTPDFGAFRGEVEDRLSAIERRSVRALEQLTETVALLSKRATVEESDESLARTA